MTEWIGLGLDVILIGVVGAGIIQAMRLIQQLRDLRAGRAEMERFVRDFNGAIMRAEAGIKGLRTAARDSGDDLEKLVEKAIMVRDELNFIVESADSVADRLSNTASGVLRDAPAPQKPREEPKPAAASTPQPVTDKPAPLAAATPIKAETPPASRAEKELLQALQKLS